MKEYFYTKEYLYLYLLNFCYTIANSFVSIFGTVMLYKNGMPIYMILLVYGLRFGLMGLLSPLFITVSRKYGIVSCSILANILRITTSYIVLSGNYSTLVLLVIVMSLSGALSNPIGDTIVSKYVLREHRGKYNSIVNIIKILAETFASIIVAWSVLTENDNPIYIMIIVFFALDCLFTYFISYKPQMESSSAFKDSLRYIINTKSIFKTIYSLRTFHIIERLFLPLYVYIAIADFKLFSIVVIVSIIIQVIPVFITGIITDRNVKKANNIISILKLMITSIFLVAKSKVTISLNKTLNDNLAKVYETTVQTSIQNIMVQTDGDNAFLSTVGQMALCFTEIITFTLLSVLARFIGVEVFKIIFVLSIFATITICFKINRFEKN